MRRHLHLLLVTAIVVPLVSPAVLPGLAGAAAPAPGPSAAERACIESAIAAGVAPADALGDCLGDGWGGPQAPAGDAGTLAASCAQVPQKPFTLDGLTIGWGSLVVCDRPIVASVFSGMLQTSAGVPLDAKAGTGLPPLSPLQFWSNTTVCPLPGSYRSAIATATIVTDDLSVSNFLLQTSGSQFVNCFL